MLVRIRFRAGPKVRHKRRKNQHLALALAALMTPGATMAFVLAAWRLAADLKLTSEFPMAGFFSHWQIWLAVAVLLQLGAIVLSRYGKSESAIQESVEAPERKLAGTRS